MNKVNYLERFLDPITDSFTPELAKRLTNLRADEELLAEIDALRLKANQGALTTEEEAAYKDFVDAVDMLSILQSKARSFLRRHPV